MTDAPTEPERLVTEYIDSLNEQAFSRLPDVLAASFTLTSLTAGTVQGVDEAEAHLRAVVDGFPDYRTDAH